MTYIPAPAVNEWLRRGVGRSHDCGIITAIRRQGVPADLIPGIEHPAHDPALPEQAALRFWCLFDRSHEEVDLGDVNVSSREPVIWLRGSDFGPSTALQSLPTVRDESTGDGCKIEICQDHDALAADRDTPMRFWVRDIQSQEGGLIKLPLIRIEQTEASQWQVSGARFGN